MKMMSQFLAWLGTAWLGMARLGPAFVVAATLGFCSAAAGYVLSFFLRLPVGATQTVLAALIAAVCMAGRAVRAR